MGLSVVGGQTFPLIRYLELGEGYMGEENRTNNRQYEYPFLMQSADGMLHLAYAAYINGDIRLRLLFAGDTLWGLQSEGSDNVTRVLSLTGEIPQEIQDWMAK